MAIEDECARLTAEALRFGWPLRWPGVFVDVVIVRRVVQRGPVFRVVFLAGGQNAAMATGEGMLKGFATLGAAFEGAAKAMPDGVQPVVRFDAALSDMPQVREVSVDTATAQLLAALQKAYNKSAAALGVVVEEVAKADVLGWGVPGSAYGQRYAELLARREALMESLHMVDLRLQGLGSGGGALPGGK